MNKTKGNEKWIQLFMNKILLWKYILLFHLFYLFKLILFIWLFYFYLYWVVTFHYFDGIKLFFLNNPVSHEEFVLWKIPEKKSNWANYNTLGDRIVLLRRKFWSNPLFHKCRNRKITRSQKWSIWGENVSCWTCRSQSYYDIIM